MRREQIGSGVFAFYFLRPEDFNFLAGQYLQITLPHPNHDDRGTSRYYTISSSPTEKDFIFITTKAGKSSFKKVLFGLKTGTKVKIFGPIGTFVLPV